MFKTRFLVEFFNQAHVDECFKSLTLALNQYDRLLL